MNRCTPPVCLAVLLALPLFAVAAPGHQRVERESEYGTIVGYKDTPLLPWTGGKFHVHDPDRPVPKYVDPGPVSKEVQAAPPDAIVLFDGDDIEAWQPSSWKVADGYVEAGEGSLVTKEPFGDLKLHVEWMVPTSPPKHMMSRGNSGVLLMGLYEIQIFDSHPDHDVHIYPDGQAAALYGQTPPRVNACRKAGEWQSFDVEFTAPVFEQDKLAKPGRVTVFHNGVPVHRDQEIMGPMVHCRLPEYRPHPPKLPLVLQGHGSPVRFRNIWVRPLDR